MSKLPKNYATISLGEIASASKERGESSQGLALYAITRAAGHVERLLGLNRPRQNQLL